MKPKLLLRIASAIMLLHLAGHTVGALTWDQAPNARVAAVVSGMKTERFDFQGRPVTLAAFFNGYGISMIFVLLFLAALLWALSSKPVRNLLVLLSIFLLCLSVCEWIWFFPLPAVMSLLAGICTGWASMQTNDKVSVQAA